MFASEVTGLIISFAYALGLLGLAEVLYRFLGVPQFYTRKFVHIWAGMWAFGIMLLFYRWWLGIIPFAVFILVNFVLHRYRLAKSVEAEQSSWGTVYFAAAITLVYALLWRPIDEHDFGPVAAAGVMALTWGDSFAAMIGKRFGRHTYTAFGTTRSFEGSAVMFLISFLVIFLVMRFIPGSFIAGFATVLTVNQVLIVAFAGATIATLAEALTPSGLDNLTVPLLASGAIWLLVR